MQRTLLIFPLLLVAGATWAVMQGHDDALVRWAAEGQREFQNALAGALRALRAEEPGAVLALVGVCFAYGFFHAVGPGHGKLLIGGYGLSHRVPLGRLTVISLLSSLGQALSAIVLVLSGLFLLDWTRSQLTDTAEKVMLPLSTLAIGLIGGWLALRGARKLWRLRRDQAHAHHGCTHRHGPTPEELRRAGGLRDALGLIAGIAARPCSGAILLLVLSWHMDILTTGILGALAMSLGTAALSILVATISVVARDSTLLSLADTRRAALVLPMIELLAGGAILAISLRVMGLLA